MGSSPRAVSGFAGIHFARFAELLPRSDWEEAGYPAVAAEFFRHASDCDPANGRYRTLYLEAAAGVPESEAEG